MAALLATTFVACGTGGSSSAKKKAQPVHAEAHDEASAGICRQVPPPAGPNLTWVPADLPLPDRTYAVADLGVSSGGAHHGVFVTSVKIQDFVRFAATQWPAKGWRLGRGYKDGLP